MNSELPSGWVKSQLFNLAADKPFAIVDGPFGTQLHHDEYVSDGVPVVRIVNLSYDGRFLNDDLVFITEKKAEELSRSIVNPNDIIIAKTGATIGKLGMFPESYERGIIASSCLKITPNSNLINPKYLLHLLTSEYGQRGIVNGAIGSTRATINITPFGKIEVYHPIDTNEQRRIVEILGTISDAIRKTEALIVKLKQIRAGLLHHLLTCGLDENGQIRNPITQPEQFKDSSVGPIPKSWRSRSLWELVPIAEYGISSPLYDSGKTPVLRMNNLSHGEASLTDLRFTNAEIPEDLILRPNDVLFNRTNSMVHVGRTGIWRGQIERATFASYLVRLTPNLDLLTPEYLNLLLNLPEAQIKMRRFATPAVQQVNINPTNLRKIVVAVPDDLQEQILVVDRISDVSGNIRQRQIILTKLQLLKHGLMSDFLTGRVRVPEGII